MKIVVDILEEDYKYFCNSSIRYDLKMLSKQNSKDIEGTLMILNLIDATKNGTPLPKGHGRLIDADAMINKLCIDEASEFFGSVTCAEIMDFINNEKPIIEADKEIEVCVVECKDCEHYYFANNRIPSEKDWVCELDGCHKNNDDYCSYGKRR